MADVEMTEQKKEPEPPKELEEDAKAVKGKQVEGGVEFLVPDTTVNIMPSTVGDLLMCLQDNGFQSLLAGARASVGIKAGRYMFEVKIVESPSPGDPNAPYPRNLLKIGFSTAGSSLLLDSEETAASFDSEGFFGRSPTGDKVSQKLNAGDVVACLLNLEKGSPNCNTISLFKDGARISQPQALPDSLKGKVLFPTVAFKCMTLHTNFGPSPMCPLPFACHMVGSASKSHAEIAKHEELDEGEVLFPVSLPDEGSFDWLDMYLEENPGYIEISDRAIRDWAEKSHSWAKKGSMPKTSNDKPEMGFGVRMLDDGVSVKRTLKSLCALQKRKYVVMEVKGNLIKEERIAALEPFKAAKFQTTAAVLMGGAGAPPAEFKKRSQMLTLQQKQEVEDKKHREEFETAKKKWQFEKKQKELEKSRKKIAKDREKAAKARAKALEEAKRKAQAAKEGKEVEEESKEEEPEEEEAEEEEPEVPEPMETDAPRASLSAEEKQLAFKPVVVPDLTPYVMNTTFMKFSLPDKEDGFDDIKYEWLRDSKCTKFLTEWIASRKLTTRVEDITPSQWFYNVKKDWDAAVRGWSDALNKYKANEAKKRAEKAAKEAKKKQAAAKAAAAKAKAEEEKKEGEATEGKKEEVVEEIEDDDDEEEEAEPDVDFENIDVFGLDDVKDIGGGLPLYKEFEHEDWTLLSLAFELHLLGHSFKKDVKDEDRSSIHVDHLDFYYSKYFKKVLIPKSFGKETLRDVVELVKDVVYINSKGALENCLQEEMESYQVFVKITEEARRFRALRIDMGEESAVLTFAQHSWGQKLGHDQGQKRRHDWGPPPGGPGKGGWGSWMPPGKKGKGDWSFGKGDKGDWAGKGGKGWGK